MAPDQRHHGVELVVFAKHIELDLLRDSFAQFDRVLLLACAGRTQQSSGVNDADAAFTGGFTGEASQVRLRHGSSGASATDGALETVTASARSKTRTLTVVAAGIVMGSSLDLVESFEAIRRSGRRWH